MTRLLVLPYSQNKFTVQWSELGEQGGPARGNSLQKPGPRVYEPQGKRFTLLQGDSETSRVFQYVLTAFVIASMYFKAMQQL